MNCIDEEGNFLRYRDNVKNVEIYIAYSFSDSVYQIYFKKIDETYKPEETAFTEKLGKS